MGEAKHGPIFDSTGALMVSVARIPPVPGPWEIVRSHAGFVVTRRWSSGFYQRMRTGVLNTEEEARAAIALATQPSGEQGAGT